MNMTIDALFMILNLAVRVGLVWYLMKKYVMRSIQNLMSIEKQDLSELKQKQKELRVACSQLEQQIKQETEMFATLQEKFTIWNKRVKNDAIQEQVECQNRQKKIEMATVCKMHYLQKRCLVKVEIPLVLDHVLQQVEKEFKDDLALGKQYQNQLLAYLEKLP